MLEIGEEKRIENSIKRWLETNNCWYIKVQGGVNNPSSGVPDILACINGRFVGIEVKRKGQVPTKIQEYQMKAIEKSGGVSIVATSIEDVRLALKESNII